MKTAILVAATFALACACAARAQQPPEARAENPDASGNSTSGARIKDLLQNNSVFWSRLGWPYNPPVLDENGNARMMLSDDSPEKKFHGDFDRAGIKIHSTILFSGWIAPAKYDYRATDNALDDLFASVGKDSMYIPRNRQGARRPICVCRERLHVHTAHKARSPALLVR